MSKKLRLDIAWTADDGPTGNTDAMVKVFKNTLAPSMSIPVTWYIQRDNLTKRGRTPLYKKLQREGHEVAIHGISTIFNHVHWFKTNNCDHKYYTTADFAVAAIADFKEFLRTRGIPTKFVRAPTGLKSELMAYLKRLGFKGNIDNTAQNIITKPNKLPKNKSRALQMAVADFKTLRVGLRKLNLHLWGGKRSDVISGQSWEVESSGSPKRTDSLKKTWVESLLADGLSHSLVILCHDLYKVDVAEVERDIKMVEDVAKAKNYQTHYHTMSSLYKHLTGKAP